MTDRIIIQKLRDFTVQIRHTTTDAIVGTGIVISLDGKIITCAHVVMAAGINPRIGKRIPANWEMVIKSLVKGKHAQLIEAKDAQVGVYFPQAKGEEPERRATVAGCFSDYEDDLIILKLVGQPPPLGIEQIPVLGNADLSIGNKFRSYGYSPLGLYPACRAEGKILGGVEHPDGKKLRADPIQLKSGEIDRGISGAAVLGTKRNLVVGIITETYYPQNIPKHTETAWAVNTKALTFDPLNVPIFEGEFLELKAPEKPSEEVMSKAGASVERNLRLTDYPAPIPPSKSVERNKLLNQLNEKWNDAKVKIVGLIGFGGEGKSSLASHWIAELLKNQNQKQLDGLFWWSFCDRRNVEEFFEAALTYLSGKDKRLLMYCKSPTARAHIIIGMLYSGNYLFVLDGLEVLQLEKGINYGEFGNDDLRIFLEYFSATGHSSFCLITSRAPVLDLIDYTSYSHIDVTRLSNSEGCRLLSNIGVRGDVTELEKAVNLWDGHALTLSLLGTYLAEAHNGDISYLDDIEPPTADEPRYERVHRILRRYDEHLTDAERLFLQIFSAFRLPVKEPAFEMVFRSKTEKNCLNGPVAVLDDIGFKILIDRLRNYLILRYDSQERQYTAHPLVRMHYFEMLCKGDSVQRQKIHELIKDYYFSIAQNVLQHPSLEDMVSLSEAVYHACSAHMYLEASELYYKYIQQGNKYFLIYELDAWETCINVLSNFFDNNKINSKNLKEQVPLRGEIFCTAGLAMRMLGKFDEVEDLYKGAISINISKEDWKNTSVDYQNLALFQIIRGEIFDSIESIQKAIKYSEMTNCAKIRWHSISWLAYAYFLIGEIENASHRYKIANDLVKQDEAGFRYIYSGWGIRYSDYLLYIGSYDAAFDVTKENLKICKKRKWKGYEYFCYYSFASIYRHMGKFKEAKNYIKEAIKGSELTGRTDKDAEYLVELARIELSLNQPRVAENIIFKALNICRRIGYRLYEVQAEIVLAKTCLLLDDRIEASKIANNVLNKSRMMEYHYGILEANIILEDCSYQ